MRIGVAVVDGCFASGVSALLDVLGTAEVLRDTVDPGIESIEVEVMAPRARVTASNGMIVPASSTLGELRGVDVAVVAALGAISAPGAVEALGSSHGSRLVRSLATLDPDAVVAGACTGSFALAEAGLLDHHRATTSWWLGPEFRKRYGNVDLDMESMVVADRQRITAGAAFAHIDLALALVHRISGDLADRVARFLVVDQRPAQSMYTAIGHLDLADPLVVDFERHVRAHLVDAQNIADVAASIGATRRTLERRVRACLGLSPIEMVQQLRVERARHLLATTDLSVDHVATLVGYANASTLRNLLRRSART